MFRAVVVALLILLAAHATAAAQPVDLARDDAAEHHIAALVNESTALSLPVRVERAFLLTLNAARDALRQGHTSRASTLLRTFAFEVRGVKRARRLPEGAADALIARAEEAIGALDRQRARDRDVALLSH